MADPLRPIVGKEIRIGTAKYGPILCIHLKSLFRDRLFAVSCTFIIRCSLCYGYASGKFCFEYEHCHGFVFWRSVEQLRSSHMFAQIMHFFGCKILYKISTFKDTFRDSEVFFIRQVITGTVFFSRLVRICRNFCLPFICRSRVCRRASNDGGEDEQEIEMSCQRLHSVYYFAVRYLLSCKIIYSCAKLLTLFRQKLTLFRQNATFCGHRHGILSMRRW